MLSEVIPYDLTYMWNLKKSNSEKQGLEWWLPGAGSGGNGEMLVKGSSYKMDKLWGFNV